jgi:8-oxo-dGTP pyrophosphatase MutT (NUDIX family)
LGIEIAKPLRLASCMVIEDADGKVLVTKRSRKMRVFPRAWVLPGGHIDAGETLE